MRFVQGYITRSSEKMVAEAEESRTSAVGSRYQATASEASEDFMCAVVTVIFGVCNSVRLS
jgi:hypothetical protein